MNTAVSVFCRSLPTSFNLYDTFLSLQTMFSLPGDMPKGTAVIISDGQRGAQLEQRPFKALRVQYWGE